MMPKPRLDKQQIAVANIKLLLDASHSKKKDLAEYLGKVPQSLSKMLQNKQTWFFEDMCHAADFFGVGLETLVRTDLTPMKAEQILKNRRSDDGNDGQVVAGHGFEPWTSGIRTSFTSGVAGDSRLFEQRPAHGAIPAHISSTEEHAMSCNGVELP